MSRTLRRGRISLPGAGGQVGEKETASVLKERGKDTGAFVDLVTGR